MMGWSGGVQGCDLPPWRAALLGSEELNANRPCSIPRISAAIDTLLLNLPYREIIPA